MRKIFIMALLLASALMANEIHWAKDYNSAIATAKKEHKPMFFLIASHECPYCNKLEQTTLVDDSVVKQLNKNFVSVIAFVDDGDYFPRQLATGGLPTVWFLMPNGEPMLWPFMGAVGAEGFLYDLKVVKILSKELIKKRGK